MRLLFQPDACFGMVRSHHSLVATRRRIGWTRSGDVAMPRVDFPVRGPFRARRRLGLMGLGLMGLGRQSSMPRPPIAPKSRQGRCGTLIFAHDPSEIDSDSPGHALALPAVYSDGCR